MNLPEHNIGVFDSGVGGFSVVRSLKARLPNENIVYFGDTARMPYGNKPKEAIIRYSLENAYFLKQHQIKILVVACNTASVHALETLKSSLPIPVVGIIEDCYETVAQTTRSQHIGILGTKSTIQSGIITKGFNERFPTITCQSIACPLFATLVEEGLEQHPCTLLMAKEYLAPLLQLPIDTVLLACTHYPFILPILKSVTSSSVTFIDPSFTCAEKVAEVLALTNLLNPQVELGRLDIYASNEEEGLKAHAHRFLNLEPIASLHAKVLQPFSA